MGFEMPACDIISCGEYIHGLYMSLDYTIPPNVRPRSNYDIANYGRNALWEEKSLFGFNVSNSPCPSEVILTRGIDTALAHDSNARCIPTSNERL